MDGHFVWMEDLDAFIAQDSLNYCPVNASAYPSEMGSSSDDRWDLQHRFESDPFTPLEVDGSDIQTQHDQDLARLTSYSLQEQDLQQGQQLLMEILEQDQQQEGFQEQQVEQQQQQEEEEEVEEEEDEVEGDSDSRKHKRGRRRSLIFERQRRKRVNQQLMTLRSLVPNITKMDKASILADALAYLKNVLQETKRLEELNLNSFSSLGSAAATPSSSSSSSGEESYTTTVDDEAPPVATVTQERDRYALDPTVTKMEACKLDEERYVLKICCNKAVGALGLVQKAIEMLGLEVTCASIDRLDHVQMLNTTFLRIRKKGVLTQEKLLQQLRTNATKLGLLL